ncbi:MAG: S-layer homology domain-containing protein [Candidatus Gracilibacteria bacterium]|jgi:hypothetical protein
MKYFPFLVISFLTLNANLSFASNFVDVPPDSYYSDAVDQLVDDGILDGSKTNFYPSVPLQRDQATKLVVLGADLTIPTGSVANFYDVPVDSWFYFFVNVAVSHGIVSGYGHRPGYFGPADPVTRGQIAKIIVNSFAIPSYTPSSPTFSDVTPNMWEYPYVEAAHHYGVINGYSNGAFGPLDNVIRADAALMVYRAKYPTVEPPPEPVTYFPTKEFDLEVVFYDDVTACYVARNCESGDTCDEITDYRNKNDVLFEFEEGSLMVIDEARATSYDFGNDGETIKYCTHTTISSSVRSDLESYINTVSDLIYSWTSHGMKIVPHFRTVSADFFNGKLGKQTGSPTGYETGHGATMEKLILYAKKAGVNLKNMDLYIGFINPYPQTGSTNDGLLMPQYVGGTFGIFNGIPLITMISNGSPTTPQSRWWLVPAMIHELTHVVNIGHYLVSGLEDVYGIESREEGDGYNSQTNPLPHCYATKHVVDGTPDPYRYFPDSYNWLNPMWNAMPGTTYTKTSNWDSYCLDDSYISSNNVLLTNPLDSSDSYSDISGLANTAKYYKFVYQSHYQPSFSDDLYTSYCKNGKKDLDTLGWKGNFEFEQDWGGGCFSSYYKCNNSSGLCFSFNPDNLQDSYNDVPIKDKGNSRIVVSGAEFFADLDEMTIEADVKFNNVSDDFMPIFTNLDRYFLAVSNGNIVFGLRDNYLYYDYPEKNPYKELTADVDLVPGQTYKIKAVLDNDNSAKIYLDDVLIVDGGAGYFKGSFMPQSSEDPNRTFVEIGYAHEWPVGEKWLDGDVLDLKFYNEAR